MWGGDGVGGSALLGNGALFSDLEHLISPFWSSIGDTVARIFPGGQSRDGYLLEKHAATSSIDDFVCVAKRYGCQTCF
jgi:hypothetical protein